MRLFSARPMKLVGAPSHLYAQHIISSLVVTFQPTTEVPDMVRLANDAFHYLGYFNVDLRVLYDQVFISSFLIERAIAWRVHLLEADFCWGGFDRILGNHRSDRSTYRFIAPGYDFSNNSIQVDVVRHKVSIVKLIMLLSTVNTSLSKNLTNFKC